MDPTDPFYPTLQKTLNYGYNPSLEQAEGYQDLAPTGSPLTFYDRHIDSKLICKNIFAFPTLGIVLSKIADDAITNFLKAGHRFVPSRDANPIYGATVLEDASTVAEHYRYCLGFPASAYSSKIYFHPQHKGWSSVFHNVVRDLPGVRNFVIESFLYIIPDDMPASERVLEGVSESDREKLKDMSDRYPGIATWQFYPNTNAGRTLLKQMHNDLRFTWKLAGTTGSTNVSNTIVPLDSRKVPLLHARYARKSKYEGKHKTVKQDDLQDNETKGLSSASDMVKKRSAFVSVTRRKRKVNLPRIGPGQYIQRAWAAAVEHDSTFITFNCGTYERIGVRHRASQALYLSPLIDTINSDNPHYGKLHIGLQVAIVQDLLQRYEQDDVTHRKKRSADHLDTEDVDTRKKARHSVTSDRAPIEEVARETNKRELALVTLDYGNHRSPVPASFLRLGSSCHHGLYKPFTPTDKVKFGRTEYFELMVGASLGEGAIGVVHPAEISLTLESGRTLNHVIAVKLAFTEEHKKKLKHEYDIYAHFSKAKEPVEGIVGVHGLFEDQDTGTWALFMEYGGKSLRDMWGQLSPEKYKEVLTNERESCLRALKEIHKAGVRHRDIRSNNILVDAEHRVSIIDFDSAEIDLHHLYMEKFSTEIKRLKLVLKGEEVDDLGSSW